MDFIRNYGLRAALTSALLIGGLSCSSKDFDLDLKLHSKESKIEMPGQTPKAK